MSILDDLLRTLDGATSKTRAVRGGTSDRGELTAGLRAERGTSDKSIVAVCVVDMATSCCVVQRILWSVWKDWNEESDNSWNRSFNFCGL